MIAVEWSLFDPERTNEQSVSGPSTECATTAVRHWAEIVTNDRKTAEMVERTIL